MPIILDHQLKEYIPHNAFDFPITYFHDELATLPNWAGPLHWHPDFEIATAERSALDYQVGQHHIILEAGDSIFVNGNMIHGIKQLSGDVPDPMPNVVFSGTLVAPEAGTVYQKYIQPLVGCDLLPFIVFRHNDSFHEEINLLIEDVYKQMTEKRVCYELAVQRDLGRIFEYIYCNFSALPKIQATRIEINDQIRLQKMLTYIHENYADAVTLEDISKSANISRSEAGRCFRKYMRCSPIEALIRYRLQIAERLLSEKTLSIEEIGFACGFNSVSYFSRQFKSLYGYTPAKNRKLGK